MSWFRRADRAQRKQAKELRDEGERHLAEFAGTRRGVEGFVEPETATTQTTVVLVATDGEWTRRRTASPAAAFALGKELGIPVYDVAAVGYPSRMREWTARQKGARD